jgi:hypothetical protein
MAKLRQGQGLAREYRLDINTLSRDTGVPVRTIRYDLAEKLLLAASLSRVVAGNPIQSGLIEMVIWEPAGRRRSSTPPAHLSAAADAPPGPRAPWHR